MTVGHWSTTLNLVKHDRYDSIIIQVIQWNVYNISKVEQMDRLWWTIPRFHEFVWFFGLLTMLYNTPAARPLISGSWRKRSKTYGWSQTVFEMMSHQRFWMGVQDLNVWCCLMIYVFNCKREAQALCSHQPTTPEYSYQRQWLLPYKKSHTKTSPLQYRNDPHFGMINHDKSKRSWNSIWPSKQFVFCFIFFHHPIALLKFAPRIQPDQRAQSWTWPWASNFRGPYRFWGTTPTSHALKKRDIEHFRPEENIRRKHQKLKVASAHVEIRNLWLQRVFNLATVGLKLDAWSKHLPTKTFKICFFSESGSWI